MDNQKIAQIKTELKSKLTYSIFKDMSTDSYKLYVDDFFIWLDKLKNEGLKRDDIYVTINEIYYEQSDFFDSNSLFEERFGNITEEVIAFCPDPFFWDVSLKEYMAKWNKGFTLGFIK